MPTRAASARSESIRRLAHVAGKVDRVLFVTPKGNARPTVVLTVGEAEWTMVFPNTMRISDVNGHLRQDLLNSRKIPTARAGCSRVGKFQTARGPGSCWWHRGRSMAGGRATAAGRVCPRPGGAGQSVRWRDPRTRRGSIAAVREGAVQLYHEFFAPELARERD